MLPLRLALAQVNPTVGDLDGNARVIREYTARAVAAGADLVAFPEMVLTGYPIEDLALRESFQRASVVALAQLATALDADGCGDTPTVVGFLDAAEERELLLGQPHGRPRNAAAVLFRGKVAAVYAKHHLPNYGVFDEYRYFVPGEESLVVRVRGIDVALAICEDLWQPGGPVARVRAADAGLLLVLNGSPYERSKDDARLELCQRRAREASCTLAYVNMVGGQDELVFDGDSMVVTPAGELLARAPEFVERLIITDLRLPAADPGQHPDVVLPNPSGSTPNHPWTPLRSPTNSPTPRRYMRRWSRGCATTCARTASHRLPWGYPAELIQLWWRLSLAMRWGPRTSWACPCPASTRHSTRRTTPWNSPNAPA